MASNFMTVEGCCKGCNFKGPLANRLEPYCVSCYAKIVVPVPQCRQQKTDTCVSALVSKWRSKRGHPRTGRVKFARKVIEDDALGSDIEL